MKILKYVLLEECRQLKYAIKRVLQMDRTLVIFSNFQLLPQFFISDKDLLGFDGVLLNLYYPEGSDQEKKAEELIHTLYDDEGNFLLQPITKDEFEQLYKEFDLPFVMIGELP